MIWSTSDLYLDTMQQVINNTFTISKLGRKSKNGNTKN